MRLALYQPDIPQNVGAAIRIAACFDAEIDIIGPAGFPLAGKALRRAAMDYAELAPPTVHDNWAAFLESCAGSRKILLTTRAESSIWDFPFSGDDIIIMGQESAGAPDDIHDSVDCRLTIQLSAQARSLNVHVAAAVTLAEARRQVGW